MKKSDDEKPGAHVSIFSGGPEFLAAALLLDDVTVWLWLYESDHCLLYCIIFTMEKYKNW